jgi:hypothetical protein
MMDQRGNNIDPQISQMDDKQSASSVKSADEFPSPCARRREVVESRGMKTQRRAGIVVTVIILLGALGITLSLRRGPAIQIRDQRVVISSYQFERGTEHRIDWGSRDSWWKRAARKVGLSATPSHSSRFQSPSNSVAFAIGYKSSADNRKPGESVEMWYADAISSAGASAKGKWIDTWGDPVNSIHCRAWYFENLPAGDRYKIVIRRKNTNDVIAVFDRVSF